MCSQNILQAKHIFKKQNVLRLKSTKHFFMSKRFWGSNKSVKKKLNILDQNKQPVKQTKFWEQKLETKTESDKDSNKKKSQKQNKYWGHNILRLKRKVQLMAVLFAFLGECTIMTINK